MTRAISLVSTLAIVIFLIYAFITYIVPHLVDSISTLTNNILNYISTLQN